MIRTAVKYMKENNYNTIAGKKVDDLSLRTRVEMAFEI